MTAGTATPGSADANAALARTLYTALADGDLAGYLDLLADDAVFHVGGTSIVAGDHTGKDAIVQLGLKVLEETGGTYKTELVAVLANDSHVTTLHRWSATRRDHDIEMANFNVYRLEDGKVVERWEFIEDRNAHDEFWAP
jgi:uncharacterized protein (TIGR02246 family)